MDPRFEIRRRLGAGGMGVVYEAFDREREAVVALKTLKQIEAGLLYRLKSEFRRLADISHENLVRLFELYSVGEEWFFTMELVDSAVSFLEHVRGARGARPSLADRSSPTVHLEEDGDACASPARMGPHAIHEARLRKAMGQLALGVDALHAMGRLHRDLKPTNVLVDRNGRVVICDFGLAIDPDRADALATDEGRLVGTAAYMSPEQAQRRALTEASDWYSVGVMLFEALTGDLPFSGVVPDILRQKAELAAPDARDRRSDAPGDLADLCTALLARDPAERPSAREILVRLGVAAPSRPSASPPRPAFVGRVEELASLGAALDDVRRGSSVTLLVTGASGVGKTALVSRFISRLHREEATVLRGRCFERESVPYKAVDSVIDALSAHLIALPRGRAEALLPRDVSALARLFPVLKRADAVAEAPLRTFDAVDPRETRRRAFAALRELFGRLASDKPLVVTIDDLQWGDADSAALLGAVMRPPGAPAILFIGCARSLTSDPFVGAWMEHELPRGAVREIAVGPLSSDAARDLGLSHLDEPDLALASTIAREAGGNPFFITELAHHARTAATSAQPLELATIMRSRLLDLPPDARRLLETLAVAGRAIPKTVLLRACDVDGPRSHPLLERLRDRRLVRSGSDGEELETWHDRVRDAVVASLSAAALRECHARLASALRSTGSEDALEMLDHVLAAGRDDLAGTYAITAAEQAAAALAFDRAAELYGIALRHFAGSAAERSGLQCSLGDALASAGRGAESARAYLAAVELAPREDALDRRRRAAEQLLCSGHFDEGLAVLDGVLREVGLALPATPRGALATLVFRRAVRRARGLKFRERKEADIAPAMLRRLDVCWSAGVGLSLIDLVRGESFQTRHLLLALSAGEPYRIARAVAMETVYIAGSGRLDEARVGRLAARSRELAERAGKPHGRALALVVDGIVEFIAGRFRSGLSLCQSAEPILREQCTGTSWELATTHYFELACLYYMGEIGELAERVPALVRDSAERGDLYAQTMLRMWPANIVWLAAGDPAEARRQVDEAMKAWSYVGFQLQHIYEILALAQIDLYEGNASEALARLESSRDRMRRSLLLRARNVRVSVLHVAARAHLALAAEGIEPAAHLASARRNARAIGRAGIAWCGALAALIEGSAAAIAGGGTTALASAAETCERADLGLFAAAARMQVDSSAPDPRAWLAQRSVRDPVRFVGMLVPVRAQS